VITPTGDFKIASNKLHSERIKSLHYLHKYEQASAGLRKANAYREAFLVRCALVMLLVDRRIQMPLTAKKLDSIPDLRRGVLRKL